MSLKSLDPGIRRDDGEVINQRFLKKWAGYILDRGPAGECPGYISYTLIRWPELMRVFVLVAGVVDGVDR